MFWKLNVELFGKNQSVCKTRDIMKPKERKKLLSKKILDKISFPVCCGWIFIFDFITINGADEGIRTLIFWLEVKSSSPWTTSAIVK